MAERRVRSNLFVLFATAGLLVAAAVATRLLRSEEIRRLANDRVLLTLVMAVVGVLLLALVFLLLRNLVKLLVERRRNVLGSRFRTKLVVSFLILCLIPSVALFYAATTIIVKTVEGFFTPTVEDLASLSQQVVDAYNDTRTRDALLFARQIARETTGRRLLDPQSRSSLEAFARSWLSSYHLDYVAIFDKPGPPTLLLQRMHRGNPGSVTSEELGRLLAPAVALALQGKEADHFDRLSSGHLASGIVPVREGFETGPVLAAVAAGYTVGQEIAARTARISKITEQYLQQKAFRQETKRVYIVFFLLLTLLILFSASWLGMYLARQITVPLQKLVEGTREVASGNLDHRVEASAGDEIGQLILSFNQMTGDLQRKGRQLDERRHYIETLLESVPAGVISLDGAGRIATLNQGAYRLLGLDPAADLRGRPVSEAFAGAQLAPLVDLLRETAGSEGMRATRELTLAAGGRTVNLAAIVSDFGTAEVARSGSLVVLEDLTLLIRSQKSAAWREAARRIAHEIKNPLTPIQLSAERILKKFREGAGDLPRVIEEGATTIISEVSSLKAMVDEFSRFARVPAVSPTLCDPRAVIESAVSLYDGTRPGVHFLRDTEAAPSVAMLDAEGMKRVLINLIDNALEAMGAGGTLTISARHEAERGVLRMEVADDGPGISKEDRDRLFLPYFSTKRRGTGLGLAIVNRIVSDHAGTIRVEENSPRGTRFIIEIPCGGGAHAR